MLTFCFCTSEAELLLEQVRLITQNHDVQCHATPVLACWMTSRLDVGDATGEAANEQLRSTSLLSYG